MAIGHKINEEELLHLFDQFSGVLIDGELDADVKEWLHETVREMATGQPIFVKKGDFTNLLSDFITLFEFNDKDGGYHFEFEGIVAHGETTLIEV